MCLNLYSHSGYDASYFSQHKTYAGRQGPLVTEKRRNKSPPLVKFHSQTPETSAQIHAGDIKPHILMSQTCCEENNEELCPVSEETFISSVQLKHICNPGDRTDFVIMKMKFQLQHVDYRQSI